MTTAALDDLLSKMVADLVRAIAPLRVILFGSYAHGEATKDSDVDLVVIMPFRGSDTRRVVEMQMKVGAPYTVDLLLWKPDRTRRTDYFTREILAKGKVMYEG